MAISALLICLALQRLLGFDRYVYQIQWLAPYFHWMIARVDPIKEGHAAVGVLILLLPVLIIVNILFAIMYHVFGPVMYFVLNVLLLWLCLDGRDLSSAFYLNVPAPQLFVLTYQRLFAVMFWFVVFGPTGLMLYTTLISLNNFFKQEKHDDLLYYSVKVCGYLDWIPLRLLGLVYALMGHFGQTFKKWFVQLKTEPQTDQAMIIQLGMCALTLDEEEIESHRGEIIHFINRVLLCSLVVILVLTVIFWMG